MIFDSGQSQGCGGCGQGHGQTQGQQQAQPIQPQYSIPVPGLQESIGAGSVVKGLLSLFGVQPCGGCQKRAQGMNEKVGFRPVGWV